MATADFITAIVFAMAFFVNRQALVLLFAHVVWEIAYLLPVNDFYMSLIGATIYAITGTVFIKLKSEIRYAVFCIACLYYLNAFDYWLFGGVETLYYNSVSYLIGAVELYALWHLVKGAPIYARAVRIVNRRLFTL